jgi:hypothetical protein
MHEAHVRTDSATYDEPESPVAVSHLVHTLAAYRGMILIACGTAALLYTIAALFIYFTSPAARMTSLPFRLVFKGAAEGFYPDGLRFAREEIVATPILLRVYERNDLKKYVTFDAFSKAAFIQESNPQYELLLAEYQALLSDTRLSPVDRERIQREWDGKLKALAKNDLSLNAVRDGSMASIPEVILRKSLQDILTTWADDAVHQRHVLEYRLPMLRPSITVQIDTKNPVVGALMVRTLTDHVNAMIDMIAQLPGTDIIRTERDHLSLAEIQIRLENIIRYRLDTLIHDVSLSEPDRIAALSFAQSQLAFDQRQLKTLQDAANGIREAAILYSNQQRGTETTDAASRIEKPQTKPPTAGGDTVMPQLSDSFLDRVMILANQAGDAGYRKQLVEEYKGAVARIIPAQATVEYDQQVVDTLSRANTSTRSLSPAEATARLDAARNEIKELVALTNEIYQIFSQRFNPATELYSMTAPATSRTERTVSLTRLALIGIFVVLVTFPLAVLFALIHNRVREEDAATADRHLSTT